MANRSLWPREHGAYFQLAIPLATACVLVAPSAATVALATAAGLAFLAHEPLLVALGHRGARLRDAAGRRARWRLALLAGEALLAAILGLVAAPASARLAAVVVSVPALVTLVLAWRRAEHTVTGELAAAIALSGASVPVLVAGGAPSATALVLWTGWSVGFGATVLAIHRVIARHKRPASRIDVVLATALVATTIACAATAACARALVVAVPLAGIAAVLVIAPPPATRLRAIGVVTAVAAAASAVAALLAVTP